MADLVGITPDPLDSTCIQRLVEAVGGTDGIQGAVVTFLGTVRNHNAGRRVMYLDYEVFEPLARRTLGRILDEAAEQWPSVRMAVWHRVGRLQPGEISVAIVAGSAHRSDAFASCRYGIERVKQIAPIWKREFFDGGDVWIEGAVADPDDPAARQQAYRRACV
jgi:molybdopterin synthase catalytic subunit